MSGLGDLANSGSAIAIGTYLVVVAVRGNAGALADLLKEETGYLDFVVALFVLGAIQKFGPAGNISNWLTGIAIVGFLLKSMAKNGNGFSAKVQSAINNFANGKSGIFGTLKATTQGK